MFTKNRAYRVKKSIIFSEDRRNLFSSYVFEYFTEKYGWRELRNYDMRKTLKDMILNKEIELNTLLVLD